MNADIVCLLMTFMENEARACSMDFGCITVNGGYQGTLSRTH